MTGSRCPYRSLDGDHGDRVPKGYHKHSLSWDSVYEVSSPYRTVIYAFASLPPHHNIHSPNSMRPRMTVSATREKANKRNATEAKDVALLAELGYQQEFKRQFTLLETFGVAFSIVGLVPSIAYVFLPYMRIFTLTRDCFFTISATLSYHIVFR